jgi:hypothetical protein
MLYPGRDEPGREEGGLSRESVRLILMWNQDYLPRRSLGIIGCDEAIH